MISMMYAEAANKTEEDAAFAEGAAMVIRLDLLPPSPKVLPVGEPSLNIPMLVLPFADAALNPHSVFAIGGPTVTNGGGDFGGSGKYLTISDADDLRFGTNDFEVSIDLRMKAALPASTHCFLFSKGVAGSNTQGWYLAILAGNKLTFSPANNTVPIYVDYPHASDFTNSHKVTLRRVAGVVSLLVGDTVVGTCTPGAGGVPAILEGAGNLYIGRWFSTTANSCGEIFGNFKLIPAK